MAQQSTLDFLVAAHVAGMEQMAKLINSVDALRKETDKLKAANAGLASSTDAVIKNGKRYNNALDEQSKALRNARQGSQMAMMQFQDFFTSVSTGADPVQAFNQQIGQLGYSMTMMQGNLGKFGRVLSGPVGIALIVATSLLGAFREQILGTGDKTVDFAKTANNALTSISKNIEESLKPALERLGPLIEILAAMWEMVKKTAIGTLQVIGWAINRILGATAGVINAVVILISNSFNIIKELGAGTMNLFAQVANYVIDGVEKFINNTKGVANSFLEYIGSSFRFARTEFSRMSQTTNKWAGSTSKAFADVGSAFVKSFKSDIIDFGELDISWKAKEDKKKKDTGGSSAMTEAQKKAKELAEAEARWQAMIDGKYVQEYQDYRTMQIKSAEFAAERINKIEEDFAKGSTERFAEMSKGIAVISEMNAAYLAQQIDKPYQELQNSFQAIGASVSDAFKGMITGATSWKDAMRGIINSVIDQLWQLYVVQQIVGFVTKAIGGLTGTPAAPTSTASGIALADSMFSGVKFGGFEGNANGTQNWRGGLSWVGERGPELVNLPRGAQVIPAHRAQSIGGSGINISVDARGSADPAAVRAQVEQGILQAAPAIIAAAQQRTVTGLRRPKLGGVMQ